MALPIPQVDGTRIVDASGRPMLWRGMGLGCWLLPEGYMLGLGGGASSPRTIEALVRQLIGEDAALRFWRDFRDRYVTRADVALAKRLGFDHLRLPFSHRLLATDELPRRLAGPGWELIDRCVGWCREEGLGLILDLHGAPGGQTGDNIDDSDGYPFLYEDADSQELCCAIWGELARRYRDEPTVWAYELLNEPIAHSAENWRDEHCAALEPLYRRMTAAIRAHDPRRIVILGGARWNTEFSVFGRPFDPQLVYAFHRYWMEAEAVALAPYVEFRQRWNVPVWLGETGENTDAWAATMRRLAEEAGIGWTWWTWKRIAEGRTVARVQPPAGWEAVKAFAAAPRGSFADIRKHRPPLAEARAALAGYLDAIRLENCRLDPGFIAALGLRQP